jgi:hypothetical protein
VLSYILAVICVVLGESIICYTCGVEFDRMPRGDDVWMNHAQKSPTCQLVLREKGEAYVERVLEEMGSYTEPERVPRLMVRTNQGR